jgi:UDP-3-O-[3-hydroxymyristoyl] N-acetylglucosamine deacetylase
VFLLQSAGIAEQDAPKRYLRIVAPVAVQDGDKWARFDPCNGFKLDFTIDFPHPMFGSENRNVVIDFAHNSYVKEVARARTFGFMQDQPCAAVQLAAACRTRCAYDSGKNSEGSATQRVRQTQGADAIGDLYLLGHPLIGQYTAYKSGHGLNNALARALLARKDAFELVSFAEPRDVPAAFQDWQLATA